MRTDGRSEEVRFERERRGEGRGEGGDVRLSASLPMEMTVRA